LLSLKKKMQDKEGDDSVNIFSLVSLAVWAAAVQNSLEALLVTRYK
jgi:hypothetical protein